MRLYRVCTILNKLTQLTDLIHEKAASHPLNGILHRSLIQHGYRLRYWALLAALPLKVEVEARRFFLNALGIIKAFNQERKIAVDHFAADSIIDQTHSNHAAKVPITNAPTPWTHHPHAEPRCRYPATEPDVAFENKIRET